MRFIGEDVLEPVGKQVDAKSPSSRVEPPPEALVSSATRGWRSGSGRRRELNQQPYLQTTWPRWARPEPQKCIQQLMLADSQENPTTDAPAAEEESGAHFEPVVKLEQTVEVKTHEVSC